VTSDKKPRRKPDKRTLLWGSIIILASIFGWDKILPFLQGLDGVASFPEITGE
jgi:hypothetical protein